MFEVKITTELKREGRIIKNKFTVYYDQREAKYYT